MLDPDELPDRDLTAPLDCPTCGLVGHCDACGHILIPGESLTCRRCDDEFTRERAREECFEEDCPACLGNHACDVHGPKAIMPNDRPTWEDHAQAIRDGDKQAIGEDMLSRGDWLKDEAKYQ